RQRTSSTPYPQFLRVARQLCSQARTQSPGLFRLARAKACVMAPSKRRDTQSQTSTAIPESMSPNGAFAELRPAMFALAYRITGNRADAEEIVQDAFLRMLDTTPQDAVPSLKAYLATITARLSLNRLRDQRARRETYVGEWLPEPILTA